jgi:RNA polymerase sigma-70 factor (ECF subfamily)
VTSARPEREDEDLVAAAVSGDSRAFEELVDRYQTRIYNLALRVTGNTEDAMDATQEAFLKVFENLARFDPRHRFFSWIYRIGLNASLDRVQGRSRWADREEWEVAESGPGPERQIFAREVAQALQATLLELPAEQRTTVILRHFHGLSYDEMAEVIGIPAKTVKSRLYAARQQLRRSLAKRGLGSRHR